MGRIEESGATVYLCPKCHLPMNWHTYDDPIYGPLPLPCPILRFSE